MGAVFGLGFSEILFILLVAVLVLGPDHMPRMARLIGQWSAKMRSAASSLSDAVSKDDDLRDIQTNLTTARQNLADAKDYLARPLHDLEEAAADARETLHIVGRDFMTQPTTTQESLPEPCTTGADIFPERNQPAKETMRSASPFMTRPLLWPAESLSFPLPAPRFLPSCVSRQVTRHKMALSRPRRPDQDTLLSTMALRTPHSFCVNRPLPGPAPTRSDTVKMCILKHGQSNEAWQRAIPLTGAHVK